MTTTLKNVLDKPYKKIIYREYDPVIKKDIFLGMCEYDGEKLIPYDGDVYNFYDKINRYESDGDTLTVWMAN